MSAVDITGQVFGRWTVLKRGENQNGTAMWLCKCECGNINTVQGGHLRNGHSKSCGCFKRELAAERCTTHGMVDSREYSSWKAMKKRCLNPNDIGFKRYGGRGITVCPEWMVFENFYADMGERPEGTSLDRIDNSKGYFSDNCRWSTDKQQCNNRSCSRILEFLGMKRTLAQWAEIADMNYQTLFNRISSGWSVHQALLTPIGKPRISYDFG